MLNRYSEPVLGTAVPHGERFVSVQHPTLTALLDTGFTELYRVSYGRNGKIRTCEDVVPNHAG